MKRVRIVFAVGGFAAALLGVALGDRRITWVAIGLLAISLLLRLILRKRANHHGHTDHSL